MASDAQAQKSLTTSLGRDLAHETLSLAVPSCFIRGANDPDELGFATVGTLICGLNASIKNSKEIRPFFVRFRHLFSKAQYFGMLVGERLNGCLFVKPLSFRYIFYVTA